LIFQPLANPAFLLTGEETRGEGAWRLAEGEEEEGEEEECPKY